MKITTTPTLFTATVAMFFTVSLTANPAKAQEKPVTNNIGSSEQLLSNNGNSLSSGRTVNLTQDSTSRGRRGLSKSELDEVTNNINLQMRNNRDPRWKREKVWFEEKWDSFSTDF